jgi:hypothetical protein
MLRRNITFVQYQAGFLDSTDGNRRVERAVSNQSAKDWYTLLALCCLKIKFFFSTVILETTIAMLKIYRFHKDTVFHFSICFSVIIEILSSIFFSFRAIGGGVDCWSGNSRSQFTPWSTHHAHRQLLFMIEFALFVPLKLCVLDPVLQRPFHSVT